MDVDDRNPPVTLHAVWLMPDVKRDHHDSEHRLTWDGAIVEELLDELGATHVVGFDNLPDDTGAVVVIPGGYYTEQVVDINDRLAHLPWCLVLVYADEAAAFPDHDLKHDNMHVWRQAPRPGQHTGSRFLPMGAPPNTGATLAEVGRQERVWDWVFAGQVNHPRRKELVQQLARLDCTCSILRPTRRFASGMSQRSYLRSLAQAKVVPCPSGPQSPDSFRLWEALEAGALPIVDDVSPQTGPGFWDLIFPDGAPFPTVTDWADLPDLLDKFGPRFPADADRVQAAYRLWRRQLRHRLEADVVELGHEGLMVTNRQPITVLIPTSPIQSHPSTEVIEETVASVRHHLPDAEIIVMVDGVRAEQEHYWPRYEEYLHRLMWLCGHQWGRCLPVLFDEHHHQVGMLRRVLDLVDTPLVLFVEHDTPLVTDEPIDWEACQQVLLSDQLRTVRFHYEGVIPDAHRHLMLDEAPVDVGGLPVIRTRQWSSRPHLSQTGYFRRLLRHFSEHATSFVEDRVHGVLQDEPWRDHKLGIYAPGDGSNLKRSLNIDGRGDDPKAGCVF